MQTAKCVHPLVWRGVAIQLILGQWVDMIGVKRVIRAVFRDLSWTIGIYHSLGFR
jgi:hypothetical protein